MSKKITKWTVVVTLMLLVIVVIVGTVYDHNHHEEVRQQEVQEEPKKAAETDYASMIGFKTMSKFDTPNTDISCTITNMLAAFDGSVTQKDVLNGFNKGTDIALEMDDKGNAMPPAATIAIGNTIGSSLGYHAENKTGEEFDSLVRYVTEHHLPVMIWVTTSYKSPNNIVTYNHYDTTRYSGMHYAVIQREFKDDVILSDTIYGELRLPKEQVRSIYDSCGKQCVVMVKN